MSETNVDGGGLRYNTGKPALQEIPRTFLYSIAEQIQASVLEEDVRGHAFGQLENAHATLVAQVAIHSQRGSRKYPKGNYLRGMPMTSVAGCLLRHLYLWLDGEDTDEETGSHHLAAVAWNAMVLLYYAVTKGYEDFDDRKR